MRKGRVWVLIVMVVAAIVLESCKANEACAAYGESRKFQVGETR